MIVAGFGFRASATRASLAEAYGLAGGRAVVFATVADKIGEEIEDFATQHGLPLVGVPAKELAAQVTLTRSQASEAARQTGSVAEAAALAAAGPGATLLAPRVVSADRMATCALAQTSAEGPLP